MSFPAARDNMVDSQVRTNDVTDAHLQAAMRTLPREDFCGGDAELAYAERETRICEGRWLLTPRDVGKLLQALDPQPGETALVIAEPYAAAILARAGLEVTTVDTPGALAIAGEALAREGVSVAMGELGVPAGSETYDIVLGGGAVSAAPKAWLDRLKTGGRAGVVIRSGAPGRVWIYLRSPEGVSGRPVFESTPPWLPGLEPKPAFVF